MVFLVPLQKNKDQKNKAQKSKFIISSDQKNKSAKQQVAKTTSDQNSKWPKQQANRNAQKGNRRNNGHNRVSPRRVLQPVDSLEVLAVL